jgi:Flp pilus assembly protein TadG
LSPLSLTASLAGDRSGAVAIVLAVSLATLTILAGLAVDAGRAHLVKGRLAAALDAGALAGGRVLGSGDPVGDAKMFYHSNLAGGLSGVTLSDPVVSIGSDQMSLSMSATASVPTTFLKIAGRNSLDISVSNTVRRVNYGMELALIMDNTGSMDANGKMVALRAAATDLINILYGAQTTVPDFWVAVVPYAAMVNIGPQRTSWIDAADLATKDYSNTTWKGCVEARLGAGNADRENNDDPPSTQRWKAFYYPSRSSQYATERMQTDPATGAG